MDTGGEQCFTPRSEKEIPSDSVVTSADSFNYAGRPVGLVGPSVFMVPFTDRRGKFAWFDPETHNVWHRGPSVGGIPKFLCSYPRLCKERAFCEATPDGAAPHNHGCAGVPLYYLRRIRIEFAVRNYYALSREVPSLAQFNLVYAFYHERIEGPRVATPDFMRLPKWVTSCAKLGFPYTCEARRTGGDLDGIMHAPIRHAITIVEANAVFESERFGLLDPYLDCALPMDYREPEMLGPLVPSWPYVRRWSIPGKSFPYTLRLRGVANDFLLYIHTYTYIYIYVYSFHSAGRVAALALRLCEEEIHSWGVETDF